MKKHLYEITVKHLTDNHGNPSTYTDPVKFEVQNHDDIFKVIAKSQEKSALPEESIIPFAVGLKLFGEVMLENKDNPLFAEFAPHFGDFMKKLKGKS